MSSSQTSKASAVSMSAVSILATSATAAVASGEWLSQVALENPRRMALLLSAGLGVALVSRSISDSIAKAPADHCKADRIKQRAATPTPARHALSPPAVLRREEAASPCTREGPVVLDSPEALRSLVESGLLAIAKRGAVAKIPPSTAVAYIAHALSEIAFLYGAPLQASLSADLNALSKIATALGGQHPGLIEVTTAPIRSGSAGMVAGSAAAGAIVSALVPAAGLLQQLPALFSLAAQGVPAVFHVALQRLTADLRLRPDLSALMAARDSGAALLGSSGAQEAHDMAVVAHAVALRARTPVIHFYDAGSSGAHGDAAELLPHAELRAALGCKALAAQRRRQHPGYREPARRALPEVLEEVLEEFAGRHGRSYRLFEYSGHPAATAVVVLPVAAAASAAVAARAEQLAEGGAKVGVLRVRLLRPFSLAHFKAAMPVTAVRVCVLDQSRNAAANAGPLFKDVAAAQLRSVGGAKPLLIPGKVALSASHPEFTQAMAEAVLDNLVADDPRRGFSVGSCDAFADAVAADKAADPTALPLGTSVAAAALVAATKAAGPTGETKAAGHPLRHQLSWQFMFQGAYKSALRTRPFSKERLYTVRCSVNRRLTPADYHRNIFHVEFDTRGSGLSYKIGDALGVYGLNDAEEVAAFIANYGPALDASALVALDASGRVAGHAGAAEEKSAAGGQVEVLTVEQLLTQRLDIFGMPTKDFYLRLSKHATATYHRRYLERLGGEDAEGFAVRKYQTVTYADILAQFSSARPPLADLVAMVPPIHPRHYSIASSSNAHPGSVHLLVVAVEWETKAGRVVPEGRPRSGQCTSYLKTMRPGALVTVDICPSVMRLPEDPKAPVVMAGLGTGLAPFRAFAQERAWQKSQGVEVGPMALYFGARNRANEYLYGAEWDAYEAEGLLTRNRLAFSRDQPHKVYIQHLLAADSEELCREMLRGGGHFYLCGPTWPVPDVRDAMVDSFVAGAEEVESRDDALEVLEVLKEQGRYTLEVY